MKCIYLKDGIYVTVDIDDVDNVSVGKAIASRRIATELLFGGRVSLCNNGTKYSIYSIKIDGINICNSEGDTDIAIGKVVSYLNAIATNGVDAFLINYKKAVEQYYNDLKDLRQEISLGISSTKSSSNSELMLKSIMKEMTFIVSILFALNIWMPAALDNQKVIDILRKLFSKLVLTMSILAEIEEVERIQALSIPAKRLIEKLQPLRSREEQTSKRWFWELLQNASDYNNSVSVRLEIDDHTVCFQHDGKPFSIKDVYNLISPDSGKDRDELRKDNIGKFGSGLVSTHILSAEICVKGAFTSDDKQSLHRFEITLNRSRFGNKDALIQDIEATKQAFKQHHEPISDDEYSGFMTSFTYNINKRLPNMSPTLDVVSEGLKQIYDVLPYTLAFMPKVKSVEIVDRRSKTDVKNYTIQRESQLAESLVYTINQGGTTLHRTFVKHTYKSVET